MPKHKYFSSDVVFNQTFESIDAGKGIIQGVKVCSEGDAKGHGVYLNKKFIRDVTRFGKEHGPGVKARFGHPNMCATSLGTYIGRYKNYRTQIEAIQDKDTRHHSIADLHLDETAKNLPQLGNAWDYILNLALSSPDMFGNSIVFTPGEEEKVITKNDDGTESVRYDATIEALHATDLVDEPAATDGLFSRFAEEEMAMQVTQFLDQHPEVYDLAVNHPDIVDTFLKRYESYKQKKADMTKKAMEVRSFFDKIKDAFLSASKPEEEGTEAIVPKELTDQLNEFETQLTELETENETLSNQITELETAKAEIESQVSSLSESETGKDSKIQELTDQITEKDSEISQLQASSTKVEGKKAGEGIDDILTLSEYEKALAEDLKKLQGETNSVRVG